MAPHGDIRKPVFDAMVQFFTDDEWNFTTVEERSLLRMGFRGKNGAWQCFAEALDEHERFIFFSVMESHVPEARRLAVAEFLTRANFGRLLGGFEMDFSDGELRYRTGIDVQDGQLTPQMIKAMVYANVMTMDTYLPGIMSVIYAGTAPAEAIDLVDQWK